MRGHGLGCVQGCSCRSGMGLNVTIGAPQCGFVQPDGRAIIYPASGPAYYITAAQYQLCQARALMAQGEYGQGAWAALHSLEAEGGQLSESMRHIGLNVNPGDFLAQLINDFWNRVNAFLNWLKSLLGQGMFWLLAIVGGAMVLYSVASSSDDKKEAAA